MSTMSQQHRIENQTVSEAGEETVVAAVTEVIEVHNAARTDLRLGLGDDAAVVNFGHGQVAMTTDTMAEGQDFRREWWASGDEWATDVGTKAAAQNLSDINAMGTTTKALLISLTLPPKTPVAWVQDFYRGVIRACRAPGAEDCLIAGGDLASGEVISVTITALGETRHDGALLTRSGAQPGDVLAVCGQLGYAAAGFALLEQCGAAEHADRSDDDRGELPDHAELLKACVRAQVQPEPPLWAGAAALGAGATAGMDLSDGLLRDATRLALASGVQVRLNDAALAEEAQQLYPVAQALGGPLSDALEWLLAGGEDYGLLAAFPEGGVLPDGFRQIGTVVEAPRELTESPVITAHRVIGAGWDSVAG